jgi:hypothetical protein
MRSNAGLANSLSSLSMFLGKDKLVLKNTVNYNKQKTGLQLIHGSNVTCFFKDICSFLVYIISNQQSK